MQLVVLAGGIGTRLFPLTKNIPKSLILVNESPFVVHQLRLFKKNNISDIVFCLGKFSEMIIDFLGDGSKFGVNLKFSIESSDNTLGTLGALKNAENLLDKDFLLVYGDSYLDIDYGVVYEKFLNCSKLGLMTVLKNNHEYVPSNVDILDDLIKRYDKVHGKSLQYVDFGLSAFKKDVLDFFPSNKKLDLSQLYNRLISSKQLAAYVIQKRIFEIGSYQGIKDLEKYLEK